MTNDRGRFVWYELMTTDVEAAKAFYEKITGWGVEKFQGGDYEMWTAGGKPMGGLMTLPDEAKKMGAPPHWLSYVGVADVDQALRNAGELGARTLVPPQDIPTVGRFAVIADPQGAVIALFKEAMPAPASEGAPTAGQISWHELATTDPDKAWSFYSTMFGWKKTEAMDMGPEGTYQMYGIGEKTLGGIFKKPAAMPGPSAWLYYVHVQDLDTAVAAVTANGGRVLNGPMDVPGGDVVAQCMDPQGAMFALHAKAKKAS